MVLCLAFAVGCSQPRTSVVGLVDILPVAETVVATDSIDLSSPDVKDLPSGEWARRPFTGRATGRLVLGQEARLAFRSVGATGTTLEIDVYPFQPVGEPAQRIAVAVNGKRVAARELREHWNEIRIDLPESVVVPGRNELTIRFAHAWRPYEYLPDSRDDRRVAALVREVRLRPAGGRPVRSGAQPRVERVAGSPTELSLPTDSLVAFYLEPPPGARLVGEAEFEPVPGARGDGTARLVVDVTDQEGRDVRLVDRRLGSDAGAQRLDVDLGEPAGEVVRMRLSVLGEVNGQVVGRGLRITVPAATAGGIAEQLPEVVAPPSSGRLGRPDVYVILLDAARVDAFSCYGSPYPTPAVDGLAAAGTRFVQARSPSSWTGQSIPGLLTGRYPGATGSEVWGSPIPDEVPTLAEIMAEAGYRTVLWSQHTVYRGNSTLRRGFEEITITPRGVRDRVPELVEIQDPNDPERPVFAFVHLVPPHGGYTPPEPFRGSLTSWYEGNVAHSARALNLFPNRRAPSELSADDVRYVRSRYLENALFADHLVGRILDRIRDAGRYDDALIFLVSDHGEAFLEHGHFLHTSTVYEEMLRIPLIVKWPATRRGFLETVDTPVSLIDVTPTIVDGLALSPATDGFQGRSLLGAAAGGDGLRRPTYALTRRGTSNQHEARWIFGLVSEGWKLIYDQKDGTVELYDLRSDPGETENLVDDYPFRARFLLQRLLRVRGFNLSLDPRGPAGGSELELDPEVVEELRALGYLQ